MRRMPFVLAGVFIAITLTRVASLTAGIMGAGWLGWLFAAGLGFGVLLYAYWLRSKTLGGRAKVGLLFLVLVDGGFNLAEVYRHMIAQGTWNDGLLKAAGITYGIFPTLACLLLGWLAGGIALLPPVPMRRTAVLPRIRLWIAAQLDSALPQADADAMQGQGHLPQSDAIPVQLPQPAKQYVCPCGDVEHSPQAFAGHARGCAVYRAHKRPGVLAKAGAQQG